MTRPLLLDLFCGAGGAAMGYHRAGFDVVGVDIEPQPNYPFDFIQGDALEPPVDLSAFDAVHASPPCQAHTALTKGTNSGRRYPDLVASTRALLQRSGLAYIIENVPGAPLHHHVQLCGSSMGRRHIAYELRRHRWFECSFPVMVPPCAHSRPVLGVYGDLAKNSRPSTRGVKAGIIEAEVLMGIDWMTPAELVQAIPPAYTQFIGEQLMRVIQ